MTRKTLLAAAVAALAVAFAPESRAGDFAVAQSTYIPASVTLSANPSTVVVGNSSTISATALNSSGGAMSGIWIAFTITAGPGTLTAAYAQTDAAGVATTTYNAPGSIQGNNVPATVQGCSNGVCGSTGLTIKRK